MMKQEERGITLVALIITIIVLVILAAVTISTLVQDQFIETAMKGAENYAKAQSNEVSMLNEMDDTMEGAIRSINGYEALKTAGTINGKEQGNSLNPTIPAGFKPVNTATSKWGSGNQGPDEESVKNGLVIEDGEGNQFVWVPCYVSENGSTKPEGVEGKEWIKEYNRHTYVNPSEDKNGSTEHGSGWKTYYYTAWADWKDSAYDDYGKASVSKYGGFWVARYEAGIPKTATFYPTTDENWGVNQNNSGTDITDIKAVSQANTFSWNYISQKTADTVARNMYGKNVSTAAKESEHEESSGVKFSSYLIDGYAWDTISDWIHDEVALSNSTNIGNYANNTMTYSGAFIVHAYNGNDNSGWHRGEKVVNGTFTLDSHGLAEDDTYGETFDPALNTGYTHTEYYQIPTGSVSTFQQKNIYDMAGNMWEWTTEIGDHNETCSGNPTIDKTCSPSGAYAVLRGGGISDGGNYAPLCCRNGSLTAAHTNPYLGFRVVLYLS